MITTDGTDSDDRDERAAGIDAAGLPADVGGGRRRRWPSGGLSAACGSARDHDGGGGTDGTIRIGYVTRRPGALAAFGEADQFVIGAMRQYFAQNPI